MAGAAAIVMLKCYSPLSVISNAIPIYSLSRKGTVDWPGCPVLRNCKGLLKSRGIWDMIHPGRHISRIDSWVRRNGSGRRTFIPASLRWESGMSLLGEGTKGLTSGCRAKVVDFPKATEGQGSHTLLVKWILDYFSNSPSSPSSSRKRSPEESEESALARIIQSNGTPVRLTRREPLYLQHDGHSRTVVGIDRATSGDWLLVFDCGK